MSGDSGEGKQEKTQWGTTPKGWWWYVLAGACALVTGVALLAFLYWSARPLSVLLIGITLASALAPFVHWMERRASRVVSILVVYLILVLLMAGIGAIITPQLIAQAEDFANRVPTLVDTGLSWAEEFFPLDISIVADTLASQLGTLGSLLVALPIRVVSSLVDIVLVFFISLYWLISLPAASRFILSLFPEQRHERIREVMSKIGSSMGGYLRASVINGLIVGILVTVGLAIMGVNYSVVLGLIAGVLEIIPALGPVIAGVLIVLVALLQSPKLALFALIFVVVLQQVENHILVPNIMRTQTDISPLVVIMALLLGSAIGGLMGALISIPLAGAIQVVMGMVIAPAIRRRTGASE